VIELSWEQVRAFRLARSLDGSGGMAETARRLCGVQAQVMSCAELALAARVDGLRVEEVRDALWDTRRLVKTWAMRGTLHLLPSDELALWSGALRTRSYLWRSSAWLRYFDVSIEELEAFFEVIGTALEREALTRGEIAVAVGEVAGPQAREHLASGWGSLLKPVAMEGGLVFGPNRGRNVVFVSPRTWIGPFEPFETEAAMLELTRRWLRVYGPGSHHDLARWWGTTVGRARKALEGLGDEVVEVEVEGRRALVLESDAGALESAKTEGPARLLAGFDPYVVGFFPRDGLVEPEFLARVSRTAGWISPVVVVGGRPVGVWEHKLRRGVMEIRVEPFGRLAARWRRELADDAERLARSLGAKPSVEVS
jgi:hypothetical protein